MKAIRYHGPNDIRLEEVPTPPIGPDDVLIRVRATGICATDVEICDGVMFYFTSGMASPPIIPGHEWSGEVVELGANVSEFAIGDHVVGECAVGCRVCSLCLRGKYNLCPNRTETGILNRDGAFAEYISFPKHYLHKCSDLPFDVASMIEPLSIALYPTKLARVCPTDIVAVVGTGTIGLFLIQTAKAYGAQQVIALDTLDDRLSVARQVGADNVVNVLGEDPRTVVAELTDGHLADVVFWSASKADSWNVVSSIFAPMARIGLIGLFGGDKSAVDFDPLVADEAQLFGINSSPNCWPETIQLLESGAIQTEPIITHRMGLEDFEQAVLITRERIGGAIKVIIEQGLSE